MTNTLHRTQVGVDHAGTLQFSVIADTSSSTIRLVGELDAQTICLLASVVHGQVAQNHVDLTIDVADLTFIDLAGFDALRDAQRHLHAHGGQLSVVGYDALFARVASVCGMEDILRSS